MHQFLSVSIIQLVFEVMAIVKLPDIDDTSFEVGATERIDELSSSQLVKAAKSIKLGCSISLLDLLCNERLKVRNFLLYLIGINKSTVWTEVRFSCRW